MGKLEHVGKGALKVRFVPGCVGAGKGAGHKPICAVYAPSSGSGGKAGRVGFCKCGGSKAKLARARCSLLLRGPRARILPMLSSAAAFKASAAEFAIDCTCGCAIAAAS